MRSILFDHGSIPPDLEKSSCRRSECKGDEAGKISAGIEMNADCSHRSLRSRFEGSARPRQRDQQHQ